MTTTDPFDGGVISADGWATFRPSNVQQNEAWTISALGVIAALTCFRYVWPWALLPGKVKAPRFTAALEGPGWWTVYDRNEGAGSDGDIMQIGLTEHQAHAIAAILNGDTPEPEPGLPEPWQPMETCEEGVELWIALPDRVTLSRHHQRINDAAYGRIAWAPGHLPKPAHPHAGRST